MSDGTNGFEPEKLLARLRELDIRREDSIRRQAVMGERHAAGQRDLTRIVGEMKTAGTSPQTIQADWVRIYKDLENRADGYEASLIKLEGALDKAEQDLHRLEEEEAKKREVFMFVPEGTK
jgi:hypothetical protein